MNLDISGLLGKKVILKVRIIRGPMYGGIGSEMTEKELPGIVVGGYLHVLNKNGNNTIQLLISCQDGVHVADTWDIKIIDA